MSENRAWTWRHAIIKSDLPPTTRHVLLTISCFMNDVGGGCYPTQEQIAEATGLSLRAVRQHLKIAEDAGWIRRAEHGFRGQKWRNHEYAAAWPETQDMGKGEASDAPPLREGAASDDKKVRHHVPTTSPDIFPEDSLSETSSDAPPKPKRKISYPKPFEAAWREYPTDSLMSKKEAFQHWKKLDDEDRDRVRRAIPGFRAYCRAHPDYRPVHMCRFISQRRFDGFVPSAPPAPPPEPDAIDPEKWPKIMTLARNTLTWRSWLWGPMPGQPGCMVPAEMLKPGDGDLWRDMKPEAA